MPGFPRSPLSVRGALVCLVAIPLVISACGAPWVSDPPVLAAGCKASVSTAPAPSSAWPMYGHDAAQTHVDGGAPTFNASPRMLWKFKTGGPVISSPVISGTAVYIASTDGYLYRLDAITGRKVWNFNLGAKLVNSTAALDGSRVFVAGNYQYLYALDSHTGSICWSTAFGSLLDTPSAPPVIYKGIVIDAAGSRDLYGFDERTGAILWHYNVPSTGWLTQGAAATVAGVTYSGMGASSMVWAVSASTGHELWHFNAQDRIASSTLAADGLVYVPTWSGIIYAVDGATGHLVWQYSMGLAGGRGTESSPAYAFGALYIGSYQGVLYALDGQTGKLRWQATLGGPINAAPVISGDHVVVADEAGKLTEFDAHTGRLLWSGKVGELRSSPAVDDGVLVIGSMDHYVYAWR